MSCGIRLLGEWQVGLDDDKKGDGVPLEKFANQSVSSPGLKPRAFWGHLSFANDWVKPLIANHLYVHCTLAPGDTVAAHLTAACTSLAPTEPSSGIDS